MKRLLLISLVIGFTLSIAACGTQANATVVSEVVESATVLETEIVADSDEAVVKDATVEQILLDDTYEDALSPRLLLALGILRLADTPAATTPEQAPELLMLWQALDNLTRSGTGADAEVNALLLQIEQTLTPEQVAAINTMQLTQMELQTWAVENGITIGSGTGTGQGTGQGMGQGANLTAEEKATRQALNGGAGNSENGLSTSITQLLITYLENLK
jgi:hypothetical protein